MSREVRWKCFPVCKHKHKQIGIVDHHYKAQLTLYKVLLMMMLTLLLVMTKIIHMTPKRRNLIKTTVSTEYSA